MSVLIRVNYSKTLTLISPKPHVYNIPKFSQIVSLKNTFVNNTENERHENYPQTLYKGNHGPLKFNYITFILSNMALSVI